VAGSSFRGTELARTAADRECYLASENHVKLLLVEDDRVVRITVSDALADAGYSVTAVADGTAALRALDAESFDLMLADIRLPGADGITVFRHARRVQPDLAALLMTAYGDVADAVAVMREGARDYLTKPFEMSELLVRLARVSGELQIRRRLESGGAIATDRSGLLGESPAMGRLRDQVAQAAASDLPVLLAGETGTGKELCARAIHAGSRRSGRPLVAINCAAIPESLFESELFGHERGAFTGADRKRAGRFDAAAGGSILLDEVGELGLQAQAKLLRVLEDGSFQPVGSDRTVRADVRLIAASNRDLAAEVARGTFRKDLYYRLNVIQIRIPPLRERGADVAQLIGAFVPQIAAREGKMAPSLDASAAAALGAYPYPGNVRELLHALERGVAMTRDGVVRLEHLPAEFAPALPSGSASALGPAGEPGLQPLGNAVREFEQGYIRRALEESGGRKAQAAQLLGISRKSLWERLREAQDEKEK
jgi:DNA-binding NtrC family response regulator